MKASTANSRTLWRISRRCDLEGLGGEKSDGRWHTAARGKRIVYLSEHPAVALIEALANLKGNPKLFPDTYMLLKIVVAADVSTSDLPPDTLSGKWRENLSETRSPGDAWPAAGASALLAVPSMPAPESLNYLFNPRHPDAKRLTIEWSRWIQYDKRLFHTHRSHLPPR